MQKKRTKTWYRKQCDILFSKIVRTIGYCERCGSRDNLQCAHVEPRTNSTLRWDENNAICLCVGCHIYWAHKNPRAFTHWFESKYKDKVYYIDNLKNIITKRTEQDYKELHEGLKAKLAAVNTAGSIF